MSVRTRLLVSWLLIVAVLSVPAVYAVQRLAQLRAIAAELGGQYAEVYSTLGLLQTSLTRLERFQRVYVGTGDPAQREEMLQSLRGSREHLGSLDRAGYRDFTGELWLQLDSLQSATHAMQRMVDEGRAEAALDLLYQVLPLYGEVHTARTTLARAVDARREGELAEARRITASAGRAVMLSLAAALAFALVVAVSTSTSLSSPLRRVGSAMAEVAGGSFTSPRNLPYDRRDEIGDLARSFRAMADTLAELDRVKAEFVSVASHELKTPLNVISGYADLLEHGMYGELNEQQLGVLAVVREHVHSLARQINQLLDISRIEAGGLSLELVAIEPSAFFEGIERSFEALAASKGIDFRVELREPLPHEFRGDPDRLAGEVLGNLLSNALKFTPPGGQIRVGVHASRSSLAIEVADTGIGIPPDQLPRIFEKYYQVGRGARSMGSGLGLAIAREVVAAHHGTLTVTSEPGQGSTFHIVLPLSVPVQELVEVA